MRKRGMHEIINLIKSKKSKLKEIVLKNVSVITLAIIFAVPMAAIIDGMAVNINASHDYVEAQEAVSYSSGAIDRPTVSEVLGVSSVSSEEDTEDYSVSSPEENDLYLTIFGVNYTLPLSIDIFEGWTESTDDLEPWYDMGWAILENEENSINVKVYSGLYKSYNWSDYTNNIFLSNAELEEILNDAGLQYASYEQLSENGIYAITIEDASGENSLNESMEVFNINGCSVGSSYDTILEMFGEPNSDKSGIVKYKYELESEYRIYLIFNLSDEIVNKITVIMTNEYLV